LETGSHAMASFNGRRFGDGGRRWRGVGAKLDDDELHDDVQFAGGDLSIRLLPPADATARFDNAATARGAGARR
jgi:hypothetical protein